MLQSASSLLAPARVVVALARRHAIDPAQLFVAYCARTLCGAGSARERRALPAAAAVPHAVAARSQAVDARRAQNAPPP